MKRLDLQPTENNIIRTYLDDSIGRDQSVHSFVKMLETVENGCSIALDSPWGNGKTFFVKQTKLVIDALNPNNPFSSSESGKLVLDKSQKALKLKECDYPPLITTYYDAWEHDDDEDPILSLVYEMMKENYCIDTIPNKRQWTDILSNLVDVVSTKNVSGLISSLKGEDLFQQTKSKRDLRTIVNEFISTLLPENGNKLIVFIDELDRCSPAYAMKLLERIKHYMLNDSLIFVFSINQIELQHTIKKFYGENFDACRYLDRFFDYRIELPNVELEKYLSSMGLPDHKNMREATCAEFIKKTNMSLREIPKYLSTARMAAYEITDGGNSENITFFHFESKLSVLYAYSVITPIAIGLKITNMDEYRAFITGNDPRWLERIILSEKMFSWLYPMLLDDKNAYVKKDEVNIKEAKEKISSLYEAVFVKSYDDGFDYQTKVGQLVFDKSFKMKIIEAVNLASKYSNYN